MDALASRAEEACLNGWPSLSSVILDGWLLRFSDGHTKRSNSVNVIAPARRGSAADLDRRIRACEALYTARGLPTIFRLSSALPREGLAEALDAAGYGPPLDETCVLVAETIASSAAPTSPMPGMPIRLMEGAPEPSWLDAFARISEFDARASRLHARILDALAIPAAFVEVGAADGMTGAVAFGAVHDGLVCLNSVATAPEHRGLGLAGRAVGAVMAWARSRKGAEGACLAVGASNTSALALYRRLGFAIEVSRYHYRIAPQR